MAKIINHNILKCPNCSAASFSLSNRSIECTSCKSSFPKDSTTFFFESLDDNCVTDSLDKIKFILKKYPIFYELLIKILSPVCPNNILHKFIANNVTKEMVAINFGSGNSNISPNISNVDIFKYPNVNLTCNLLNIPIKDSSVDVIINIAVLEHIKEPEKVVSEFERILKVHGKILCFFPFIQGFHASPYDFSRRTIEGTKILFSNFKINEIKAIGPTSGFLWIFQNWIALCLSFGSCHLYRLIYLFVMVLTFPLKYLDIILNNHPDAKDIATGFYIIAQKE